MLLCFPAYGATIVLFIFHCSVLVFFYICSLVEVGAPVGTYTSLSLLDYQKLFSTLQKSQLIVLFAISGPAGLYRPEHTLVYGLPANAGWFPAQHTSGSQVSSSELNNRVPPVLESASTEASQVVSILFLDVCAIFSISKGCTGNIFMTLPNS